MSAFNPYSYWFGLAGKEKPDTYYELLGLPHGESNVSKITERIEQMVSKLDQAGPGDHFPEWNQMRTELQIARNCLCNPRYKADYDAKHPAPAQSSAAAAVSPGMASPFGAGPQAGMHAGPQAGMQQNVQPGMMPMQGVQPGVMPMQAGYAGGVVYQQPGMMPMQGVQPGMMPMQAGYAGGVVYQQPGMMPMQGVQPGMMPMQAGYAGGVVYQQPGMAAQGMPVQPAAQPVQQGIPAQGVPVQPAPQGGVQGNAQGAAQGVQASQSAGASAPQDPASLFASGGNAAAPRPASRSGNKSSKKKSNDVSPMVRNIIAIGGLVIVGILGWLFIQKKGNDPSDPSISASATENGDVRLGSQNGSAQSPAGDEDVFSKPLAVDEDFQTPDFESVRHALQSTEYDRARVSLEKAEKMKLTKEDQKRLARLQTVTKYAEEFYSDIEKKLNSGIKELELCNGEYYLVETKKGSATIQIEGHPLRFTLTEYQRRNHDLFDIFYRHFYSQAVERGDMDPPLRYAAFLLSTREDAVEKATALLALALKSPDETTYMNARHIGDEFGINGLGAMTNQALEEEAKTAEANAEANAEGEKNAAEADKKTDADGDAEAKNPQEEASDADAEKKSKKKKSKKTKDASDGDEDAEKAKKDADAEADAAAEAAKEQERQKLRHETEWKQMTTAIRQDISWRRISSAQSQIHQLEKLAETDAEKEECERLKSLADNMSLFVTGIAGRMGGFTPMSSVTVDGIEIGIVESMPGRLVVRDQGVNRAYTIENLNPKLVEWLMGKPKTADDFVLYGTYLAMDPEGDRVKAKAHWTSAVKEGFDKDTIDMLMKELDVPLPDAGRAPVQTSARNPRARAQQPAEPQTIPRGEDYENALAKLKKEFAKDYAKEDMRSQKLLAEKFLKMSQMAKRPADEAYAMTEEAVRMALAHSFFETAYDAYLVQESRFGRDTYQDRMKMIEAADPDARGKSSASELTDCAIRMGLDAVQRQKKIDANQMLNVAKRSASGAQNQRVRDLERQLMMMK
ncbi:MAG: hypothetical protein IJD43_08500 [Thermoguttaceae bacterium]|nr:hypothetical protein [Thermoguttaceae bacterium]